MEKSLTKKESEIPAETGLIVGIDSVKRASKIATELRRIVEKQKLFSPIDGKKYVTVEGWNTLGAMLGVFPEVNSVERVPGTGKFTHAKTGVDVEEIKYIADVSIKTLSGATVGRASAICSNKEKTKQHAEEYVIMSMAETRATGKAFRLSFSWIIKMAGYEPTADEDMPGSKTNGRPIVSEPEIPSIQ